MMFHAICQARPLPTQAFLAAFFLATLVCSAFSQISTTPLFSVPPPEGLQSGGQAGWAVATDGVRTVVGVPQDDTGASNAGVAKVYDAVTGALQFVLPNPAPASADNFGDAVAISGTRVVVAASEDDLGAGSAGTVYVYDLGGSTPTVPVIIIGSPAPQANGIFGDAIALSGSLLVVGAYNYDTTFSDAGRVWIFDLSSGSPGTPVLTLDKPAAVADDEFGVDVAISGTKVVVGCRRDDTGAGDSGKAYVYDLGSGTPGTPAFTLSNPTPQLGDFFGGRVAISGNMVAVGAVQDNTGASDAGSVYLYNLAGALPAIPVVSISNPNPEGTDYFGWGLAMSGSRLVVGTYLDNAGAADAGSVYVYDITSSSATLAHSLFNPTPAVNDRFGWSVGLAGSKVVVGAYLDDDAALDAGAVWSYDLSSGTPTVPALVFSESGPSQSDEFGHETAISGGRLVVGSPTNDTDAPNGGMVYVYDLSSGTPGVPALTIHNPTPAADDQFGYTVSLSGSLLAVNANGDDTAGANAGAVYVYDLAGATPAEPAFTLLEPVPSSSFGFAMEISGTEVLVGANFNDTGATDAGAAYVFDLAGATPTVPAFTLNNPSPALEDRFGRAVGLSGNRAVVGVYLDDTGATNSGCAYVYDLGSGTPTVPALTINNPSPASSDWFARELSISGSRLIIGTALDNTGTNDAGSAYVYDLAGATPTVPAFTLNNPEPASLDEFGSSVDVSGNLVLVSAYFDDHGATDSGSVYLYDLASATPLVPMATFRNPTPGEQDLFGNHVSLDGTLFVVGAYHDDTVSTDKGFVYVYGSGSEIAVEQPLNTGLTDGSVTAVSFGDFKFGATAPARVFTVRNTGITNLLNLGVTKDGPHAADFTVDSTSLGTFIAPGASATFSVTLSPSSPGLKTAALHIGSTDLDENPFDIVLSGQGYSATMDTDGDGMKDWQEVRLSALGFNWQTPNVDLVNTYFDSASENSLYTPSQVQDLNVGIPLIQRNPSNGTFTLTFGVEKSGTLGPGSWIPFPMTAPQTTINGQGKLEFQFTVPDSTAFFRLQTE